MCKLRFDDDQSHITTFKSLKMADVDPAAKFKIYITLHNLFANLKGASVNNPTMQKFHFSSVISFTPNLKIKMVREVGLYDHWHRLYFGVSRFDKWVSFH